MNRDHDSNSASWPGITHDSSFLAGGGSDPSAWHVDASRLHDRPRVVDSFADRGGGVGVYAMALAPDARTLAAATRPVFAPGTHEVAIPSRVMVWDLAAPPCPDTGRARRLLADGLFVGPEPPGSVPPGVVSLAFLADGRLMLGLEDGKVELREVSPGGRAVRHALHQGGVCAILPLDRSAVVTYGQDGRLCRWDTLNGSLRGSVQTCPPSQTNTPFLATLVHQEEHQHILFGCGNGHLHRVEANSLQGASVQVHQGQCSAVAWLPDLSRIVTGGFQDGAIAVLDKSGALVNETVPVGAGVMGFLPLLGGRIGVVEARRGVSLWDVAQKPARVADLAKVDVRSWAAFPIRRAHEIQLGSQARRREGLITQTREQLASGETEATVGLIKQVEALGAHGEAAVFRAGLCRKGGLLLDELRIWKGLESWTEGGATSQLSYVQGDLLLLLNEPDLAEQKFLACGDYLDAISRAEQCRTHRLYSLEMDNVIRADFSRPEQILEEIEKCSVLERPFAGQILMHSRGDRTPRGLDLKSVKDKLDEQIKTTAPDGGKTTEVSWQVKIDNACIVNVSGVREVELLLVKLASNNAPFPYLQYGLEIRQGLDTWREIHRFLFVPPAPSRDEPLSEYHQRLVRAWQSAWGSPEGKRWMTSAALSTRKGIFKLANILKSQKRQATPGES